MTSLRARIAQAILPLTGMHFSMGSERRLRLALKLMRRVGPALPPAHLRVRARVSEATFDGCRVFTVAPRDGAPGPRILYLHGGGYVFDISQFHWGIIGRLVRRLGATVTAPVYPLAPEADAGRTVAFATALFRDLAARDGRDDLVIMGDSAGGGLSLAVAQQVRDAGGRQPARLVLISPWLDVTCTHPDQPALAKLDRMLDIPGGRIMGRWYAGARAVDDPLASPLFGDLRGLPPLQVFTGTHDVLYPDARRLHALCGPASVACDLREYPGMFHVWPLFPVPEARRAFAELTAFLAAPPASR